VGYVPNPLLLRKPGGARNRTRDLWICIKELWLLYRRGGPAQVKILQRTHTEGKYVFKMRYFDFREKKLHYKKKPHYFCYTLH
jgi:hypothetical protein